MDIKKAESIESRIAGNEGLSYTQAFVNNIATSARRRVIFEGFRADDGMGNKLWSTRADCVRQVGDRVLSLRLVADRNSWIRHVESIDTIRLVEDKNFQDPIAIMRLTDDQKNWEITMRGEPVVDTEQLTDLEGIVDAFITYDDF